MSTLVAVALGNSSAAATLAVDGTLGPVGRAPVDRLDGLADVLARACPDCGGEAVPLAVASVNPPALEAFQRLAARLGLARPDVAGADFPIPVADRVERRAQVGTDRLLACLAAYRRAGGACVVVDCGTATTVNAVSVDGALLGGAIFPGPALMARALAQGTAQLPEVDGRGDGSVIGRSTREAILAGIERGWTGGVLALVAETLEELGGGAALYLTGGGVAAVAPHVADFLGRGDDAAPASRRCHVVPDLVLEGLVIAYREWQTALA